MVSKNLHWMHVYSDANNTLLEGHKNRGKQAMDEIGILPKAQGTIVHDRYTSYSGYTQAAHALCNAHPLRELKSIEA
jgi:transposase